MTVNAEIDLSLPENELIAYVKLLKMAYENDKDIRKTTGCTMLADDMKLDSPRNRAYKWGDMFFVYDAIELGMKKGKVQNILYEYHEANPHKATKKSTWGIDHKTITQYHRIMKSLILQIGKDME